MPSSPWQFLNHPGPIAFAHRGGASEAPENTLPAFEAAVSLGYSYVETDVHLTADGVLLAFHDDHLDRVTDRTGEIASLPWSEVRRARVDGREPIPSSKTCWAPGPTSGSTSTRSTMHASTRWLRRSNAPTASTGSASARSLTVAWHCCADVSASGCAPPWVLVERQGSGPLRGTCRQDVSPLRVRRCRPR